MIAANARDELYSAVMTPKVNRPPVLELKRFSTWSTVGWIESPSRSCSQSTNRSSTSFEKDSPAMLSSIPSVAANTISVGKRLSTAQKAISAARPATRSLPHSSPTPRPISHVALSSRSTRATLRGPGVGYGPAMADSAREIENLLYTYAERIDAGDLEGVADLFRHGRILADDAPEGMQFNGRDEVLAMYQASTLIYEDTGTPKTQHVTTNAIIEVDDDAGTATARTRYHRLPAGRRRAAAGDHLRPLPRLVQADRRHVVVRCADHGRGSGGRPEQAPEVRARRLMAFERPLFDIAGKTALVTGGGQGIGTMIAEGFVRAGVTTYIASRKTDVNEQTAAELSAHGKCIPLTADLSTTPGCEALVADLVEREPNLDILVNNSGATWGAPFEEFPDSAWDRVLDLNVRAPFTLIQLLLPALRARATADDPARVINIGSIMGERVGGLQNYSYTASKAAIHHLTAHLARELGGRHLTVNAIAPGSFRSRMMQETIERTGDAIVANTPLGRLGEPDDVAGAAIYLASRAGRWVTGAVLTVDGGYSTTV